MTQYTIELDVMSGSADKLVIEVLKTHQQMTRDAIGPLRLDANYPSAIADLAYEENLLNAINVLLEYFEVKVA